VCVRCADLSRPGDDGGEGLTKRLRLAGAPGGETRIFVVYAVDSSAPCDRKIEPLMAATAKMTNASMGKAP
jgi:hypothetical protein